MTEGFKVSHIPQKDVREYAAVWDALLPSCIFRLTRPAMLKLTLLGYDHQTCMKLTSAECTVESSDDGQRRCPKHVEFYNRINLNN